MRESGDQIVFRSRSNKLAMGVLELEFWTIMTYGSWCALFLT